MTKSERQKERDDATEKLRGMLKPGDEVRTILRHVSRSGMQRSISIIIGGEDMSYLVARALGDRIDQKNGGVKAGGCGMDMGFHLVYNLSSALYRDGFGCVGKGCPSNDHSNGDRNYAQHMHKDGGYALRQRWL